MGEMPLPVSPMQIVAADLIGPFPTSPQGNKYILTVIDHHTGYAEALPIASKTSNDVWKAFHNEFIARHGCPEVLITDNGKEFTAKHFTEYLEQLGIEHFDQERLNGLGAIKPHHGSVGKTDAPEVRQFGGLQTTVGGSRCLRLENLFSQAFRL